MRFSFFFFARRSFLAPFHPLGAVELCACAVFRLFSRVFLVGICGRLILWKNENGKREWRNSVWGKNKGEENRSDLCGEHVVMENDLYCLQVGGLGGTKRSEFLW